MDKEDKEDTDEEYESILFKYKKQQSSRRGRKSKSFEESNVMDLRTYLQCEIIFQNLQEKYKQNMISMSEIEQMAFLTRLKKMARRQVVPYGEEFLAKKPKKARNEELIRTILLKREIKDCITV